MGTREMTNLHDLGSHWEIPNEQESDAPITNIPEYDSHTNKNLIGSLVPFLLHLRLLKTYAPELDCMVVLFTLISVSYKTYTSNISYSQALCPWI